MSQLIAAFGEPVRTEDDINVVFPSMSSESDNTLFRVSLIGIESVDEPIEGPLPFLIGDVSQLLESQRLILSIYNR